MKVKKKEIEFIKTNKLDTNKNASQKYPIY
jgi:hypothetical protein